MIPFDPSLYLVTDDSFSPDVVYRIVMEAVEGGATMVQLRDKKSDRSQIEKQGRRLLAQLRPVRVPLLINDYPEVAKEIGADGVHLGPQDLPPTQARERLGEDFIIGLTLDGAPPIKWTEGDYAAATVFSSPTKDVTPIGVAGLQTMRRHCPVPLVAIGGVTVHNAEQVIRAGAHGVAVISAIFQSPDPGRTARELRQAVDRGRR